MCTASSPQLELARGCTCFFELWVRLYALAFMDRLVATYGHCLNEIWEAIHLTRVQYLSWIDFALQELGSGEVLDARSASLATFAAGV